MNANSSNFANIIESISDNSSENDFDGNLNRLSSNDEEDNNRNTDTQREAGLHAHECVLIPIDSISDSSSDCSDYDCATSLCAFYKGTPVKDGFVSKYEECNENVSLSSSRSFASNITTQTSHALVSSESLACNVVSKDTVGSNDKVSAILFLIAI